MKTLAIILMALALSGCITSSYKHDAQSEHFKVTSLFKAVDGLHAERDGFLIKVDKTSSQTEQMNLMMEMMMQMYQLNLQPPQ